MKVPLYALILRKSIYLTVFLVFASLASYLIMGNRTQVNTKLLGSKIKSNNHQYLLPPHNQGRVILIWSPLFEEWAQIGFLTPGASSFKDSKCPETRCEITSNRQRLLQSDAVLFHVRTMSMFDVPHSRTRRQKWIFFSLEAPPYSRFHGFDFMCGMFNWTMTYRSDSDVVVPYGRIVHHQGTGWNATDLHRGWKRKTKMAVWMVSHCETAGNREMYVSQLKNFVEVDTYGSCGFASCPPNKTDHCIERFSKQYHFFLAFENALCEDYVTEKLFRTLRYGMIPVVFGGGNYSQYAPPDSFIDALAFSSPKQLADRMLRVASNFSEFLEYFQWRAAGFSEDTPSHCELCEKLYSRDFERESIYGDIDDWWVKRANCRTWESSSLIT